MPDMFVPEVKWGKNSWARQHSVYVRGQIEHGLNDAKYGYWGFSPSSNPDGGYREYGVDIMGLDTPGYTSDQERTSVDVGFEGCREATAPARGLRRRGGDAARGGARAAVPAEGRADRAGEAAPRLRQLRPRRLLRRDRRAQRQGRETVPGTGPGNDHGRAGEPARRTTSCATRSPVAARKRTCARSWRWRSSTSPAASDRGARAGGATPFSRSSGRFPNPARPPTLCGCVDWGSSFSPFCSCSPCRPCPRRLRRRPVPPGPATTSASPATTPGSGGTAGSRSGSPTRPAPHSTPCGSACGATGSTAAPRRRSRSRR